VAAVPFEFFAERRDPANVLLNTPFWGGVVRPCCLKAQAGFEGRARCGGRHVLEKFRNGPAAGPAADELGETEDALKIEHALVWQFLLLRHEMKIAQPNRPLARRDAK